MHNYNNLLILMNYIGCLSTLAYNLKSKSNRFKAQRSRAPKYLVDVIFRPHLPSSNRPLRSLNRLDLLVQLSRTALAQSRSFASIGPTLWNALSLSVRDRQSFVFLYLL